MLTVKDTLDRRIVINLDRVEYISTITRGTGPVTSFYMSEGGNIQTEESMLSVLSRIDGGYRTSDRHDHP